MVSNSKDDHPSNVTPIMNVVPNTHPKTAKQTLAYLPVGEEKSKQPMAHTGVLLDSTYMVSYGFHFGQSTLLKVAGK